MGATSRRKGRRWENAVVGWLRDHGLPHVQRNEYVDAQAGDILGVPGWSLECKNSQRIDLAGWVDQAAEQAAHAGVEFYACIVKRRGTTDPGDAYVVMPLHVYTRWLQE